MTYKTFLVCTIFFGGLLNHAYANEEIPITIINPIKFKNTEVQGNISKSEIENLFDFEVEANLGKNRTDVLELTNSKNESEKKKIKTCREYMKYRPNYWWPYTTVQYSIEKFFKDTCSSLEFIKFATPSKYSQFEEPYLDDLSTYPAEMLDGITVARGTLCEGAKTLSECAKLRNGKLKITDGKLFFEDDSYGTVFTPSLKGDLNNDGYEDLMFHYGCVMKIV